MAVVSLMGSQQCAGPGDNVDGVSLVGTWSLARMTTWIEPGEYSKDDAKPVEYAEGTSWQYTFQANGTFTRTSVGVIEEEANRWHMIVSEEIVNETGTWTRTGTISGTLTMNITTGPEAPYEMTEQYEIAGDVMWWHEGGSWRQWTRVR